MLGLKAIASYIPPDQTDNIIRGAKFGESEDFIRNKIGAVHLPVMDKGQDTSDLAVEAIKVLALKCPSLDLGKIDALIVVTQNPDGQGLPHTSAIVQRKLGLPDSLAAFDLSLGCSGFVYAAFAMKGFLQASGLKNGLVVTADPYSKIVDPEDRVTSLLFGDGATATWIGEDPVFSLDAVSYGTDGSGSEFLQKVEDRLQMNGRQVFSFAITKVAPQIKALLAREGLAIEDIDLYCLHQGSGAIVDAVARQFGDCAPRFVKDLMETGNTVSSSIPLILEHHAFDSNANKIIICGFGVGFSWATALLTRNV